MTEIPPFEVDDAIVLLLGAPAKSPALRDRLSGVTRLEKLIFLMERETPIGSRLTERAEFVAHNFGPFSQRIYQAIDLLSTAGLLTDSASMAASDEDSWETEEIIGDEPDARYTTRDFELTDLGKQYYHALIEELPRDTEDIVAALKAKFAGLSLRQLIRYVYTRYPQLTEKSQIRDQILRR